MVELVWKGKHKIEPANLLNTKFPAQHLYTYESHPEQSSSNLIKFPLKTQPHHGITA